MEAIEQNDASSSSSSSSSSPFQQNLKRPKAVPVAVTLRNLCLPPPAAHDNDGHSTSGTTIRIEMEIVAPYSLFMQLKLICSNCPTLQKRMMHVMSENRISVSAHNATTAANTATTTNTAANTAAVMNWDANEELVRLCTATSQIQHRALRQPSNYSHRQHQKDVGVARDKPKKRRLPAVGPVLPTRDKNDCGCDGSIATDLSLSLLYNKQLVGTDSHPLWDHICDCMDDLYDYWIGPHGTHCRCCNNNNNNDEDDDDNDDDDDDDDDDGGTNKDDDNDNGGRYHARTKRDILHDLWNKIICSTMIQCHAILDDGNNDNHHNDHDDSNHMDDHDANNDCRNHDADRILLAMSSLNYSDMIPLPLASLDHSNDNTTSRISNGSASAIVNVSKFANAIPHSLPRNSILVHYSDGSSRVSPELYQCLVERGVIQGDDLHHERIRSSNGLKSAWQKYEKRFDDDVFEVLKDDDSCHNDQGYSKNGGSNGGDLGIAMKKANGDLNSDDVAGSSASSSSSSSSSSVVSLESRRTMEKEAIVNVKQTKAPVIKMKWNDNGTDPVMKGHAPLSFSTPGKKSNGKEVRGSFAEAFQSLSSDRRVSNRVVMGDSDSTRPAFMEWVEDRSNNVGDESEDHRVSRGVHVADKDATVIRKIQELEEELQNLEEILILEENALKKQEQKQREGVNRLKGFIATIERIDDERKEIEKEAMDTENECVLEETLVRRKRRELLEDLEKIYPIRTGDVFTICGLPIPKDMHCLSASDEIISAGLGFVCLVIIICSKYLSVPLRYRLIFNSSRSAVREDFEVYPLFKERVVEKEQFDRGIVLLNRNIDHLLEMRGVTLTKESASIHILSKVDLLLRYIDQ